MKERQYIFWERFTQKKSPKCLVESAIQILPSSNQVPLLHLLWKLQRRPNILESVFPVCEMADSTLSYSSMDRQLTSNNRFLPSLAIRSATSTAVPVCEAYKIRSLRIREEEFETFSKRIQFTTLNQHQKAKENCV